MATWRARELGTYLQRRRQALKLSARELGRQAGVDAATVLRLEQGEAANPGTATLEALANALGLSLTELVTVASPDSAERELPALNPYLRVRYPHLSIREVNALSDYFDFIQTRYGHHRPAEGRDEH